MSCKPVQGIIHRDLKGNNVFCCAGGVVKLGDFGISKARKPPHVPLDSCLFRSVSGILPAQAQHLANTQTGQRQASWWQHAKVKSRSPDRLDALGGANVHQTPRAHADMHSVSVENMAAGRSNGLAVHNL